MYWVANWLPASPTCPAILRQSDLSPGWMLVLWGWMSDELYRFPAQLLISQPWSYPSGNANLLLKQVSSSLLLRAVRQGILWEVGNCLFTNTSESPAPSLNKLTIVLQFLLPLLFCLLFLLLGRAPSNIILQQEPKNVSNGKTKGCLFLCAACNNQPHSLKCLPKECCDVKFQRKTLAPNQTVSCDNVPRNTINISSFTQGISSANCTAWWSGSSSGVQRKMPSTPHNLGDF